ncbi:MAG: class I tRNA ligase family protein [Aquificae bacterium]|nr:class I tRNA ligase family protein [Aquificota bacterium]
MKIKEFLKEHQISVGDNAALLLEKLGLLDGKLLTFLESKVGEAAKMSKSKGNVVDPEEAVKRYGADTVRLYVLFAAPPEQDFEWTEEGIQGAYRFLNRYWQTAQRLIPLIKGLSWSREELRKVSGKARELRREAHRALKEYLEDFRRWQFNTAVAEVMKLLNALQRFEPKTEEERKVAGETLELLTLMLSPITPHVAEEVWEQMGKEGFVSVTPLPEPDEEALKEEEVELVVQVNGKVRDRIRLPADAGQEEAERAALASEKVKKFLEGKEVKKVIFVKGKLINFVVG